MDKASVIALRSSLLQEGKNRSVRIAFDNGVILSSSSDIVIWNDDKEIVIGFTADSDGGAYAAGMPIRMIGSTYENIQFIMGNTNVENLETAIDSLSEAVTISSDDKKKIMEWYRKLFSKDYELSRNNYNPIDIKRGNIDIKEKQE